MIATALGVELLQPEPVPLAERADFRAIRSRRNSAIGRKWPSLQIWWTQAKAQRMSPTWIVHTTTCSMRAYGNSRGDVVLLALAYGRNQRQEVKIHRPDVCYTAQGFQLVERSPIAMPVNGDSGTQVQGMRMLVKAPGRVEAVSYWIRIGDVFTGNAWSIRYHIFKEGMSGRAVDGVLVRASQIVQGGAPSAERYRVQEAFLADLVRALPAPARQLLLG